MRVWVYIYIYICIHLGKESTVHLDRTYMKSPLLQTHRALLQIYENEIRNRSRKVDWYTLVSFCLPTLCLRFISFL